MYIIVMAECKHIRKYIKIKENYRNVYICGIDCATHKP